MNSKLINGVDLDEDVARIKVCGIYDKPGNAYKLFSLLAKENINVDVISQSGADGGMQDISFTVATDMVEPTMRILEENQDYLKFESYSSRTRLAKIAVEGEELMSNPGVAAKIFDALASEQINIKMISTSEIELSVIVDIEDAKRAVKAVQNKFAAC